MEQNNQESTGGQREADTNVDVLLAAGADGEPSAKRRIVSASTSGFLSEDELNSAKEKKWLDDWEFKFYTDQMAKQGMSEKQMEIKVRIFFLLFSWCLSLISFTSVF